MVEGKVEGVITFGTNTGGSNVMEGCVFCFYGECGLRSALFFLFLAED